MSRLRLNGLEQRAAKRRGTRGPRIDVHVCMTHAEADALAKRWYGPHAEANDMPNDPGLPQFAVGYWNPNPDHPGETVEDEFEREWGHYACEGQGTSWAAAFLNADRYRWRAYLIERRKKGAREIGREGAGA